MRGTRAALDVVGRLFFPPVCLGCRNLVAAPGTLCSSCWKSLRFIEQPWCPVYGTPFEHEMHDGHLSAEAIANPPPFDSARSAVSYTSIAQHLVRGLKFGDRTDLAPWMARWMHRVGEDQFGENAVIVPIPLHRSRYLKRRFNQSAELGRALASISGLQFAPQILIRKRMTRQQVGLKASQRLKNVQGAFAVPDEAKASLVGRSVVLVDDVYTTGATAFSASRALKRGGAGTVHVLTFARVLPEDFAMEDRELI
ncbi:ComF family protein [Nitratireductor basaltis]|uniref:ComF family protein n=1 Tax=Nitratireductor basaltis TaxID=472175 RepID=UPI001FCBE0F7|nr:ComF family protein [Nitratireductor basaltis]